MSALISELVGAYATQPILVIGGGPSAIEDLKRIDFEPACVLSANQHGFLQDRFKPDFAVCIDHKRGHTDEMMQSILRPFTKPIIGLCHWCDYRLADWPLSGNSGLTAIAVAVLMGGYPVVAVGMDGFRGEKYFHDKSEPPEHWSRDVFGKQARELEAATQGAWVHVMSGPLKEIFWTNYGSKDYEPAFVKSAAALKSVRMRATTDFMWFNAQVLNGTDLVASDEESKWMMRHQYATRLDA